MRSEVIGLDVVLDGPLGMVGIGQCVGGGSGEVGGALRNVGDGFGGRGVGGVV